MSEVDQATAIMSQHQEHVQDLEADGGSNGDLMPTMLSCQPQFDGFY
jgi:hypothetical protein